MTEHGSNFQMQLLSVIEAHIYYLIAARKFEKYFAAKQNATLDANSWILCRFTYDNITIEIEYLIDL